jgi:molybdopterin synthase sulfur carrier subunit
MNLKVSFHATIREAAGTPGTEIAAASVRELLQKLRGIYGARLFDMLVENGNLREDVIILVNGTNISFSGGMDATLSESDDVAIFPPVSGG